MKNNLYAVKIELRRKRGAVWDIEDDRLLSGGRDEMDRLFRTLNDRLTAASERPKAVKVSGR